MEEEIYKLLSDALPAVNFKSDFLFGELDSLGVVTIMMILSREYDISMEATDVTPKNFRSIDSLTKLVENKISKK